MNRSDRLALAGLVAVPAVLFLVPLAFGHVLLPGDDLTQNYPLRVLSGTDLRHGSLPLWNPYSWSGTALLGGFNAGSLYPATLLFAFLPGPLAWGLGQTVAYAAAGTGMLLFLRHRGQGTLAALLGAVVFSWGGFMAAQMAHVGLVEGMAWAPWMLLALDRLAGCRASGRAAWAGVLGLLGGLVCLAGEPRAVSNVAIVVGGYAVWLVWRAPPGGRRALLGWIVLGAVVAGLVGSAQLLPGLAFQAGSQRSGSSLDAFGAGSLAPPLLLLEAFPFVLGGFISLHLPPYTGNYNLAEVSGYLGVLGLAGALAVAVSWRRIRAGTGIWVVLGGVGIVLALGRSTPLAEVLQHVPLYGGQRLQSRNLGVADLAGAVLFAVWVDRFVAQAWRGARAARAVALAAPACVLALVLTAVFWPGGVAHWLRNEGAILPREWPYVVAALSLAGGAMFVLLRGNRWDTRGRARAVAALTVVDIGFFLVNAAYGWAPTNGLAAHSPAAEALAGALPRGSRFVVYDPGLGYPGYIRTGSDVVPVPDLNVLSGTRSAQGYGSVVQAPYDRATGTHVPGTFDPGILTDHRADQLEIGLVLAGSTATPDVTGLLVPPRWVPVGPVAGLAAWRNSDALSPAVLEMLGGSAGAAAEAVAPPVRVDGPGRDGGATFHVDTPAPVVLVRSESWAPGWRATLTPVGPGSGAARTETVRRSGFLQAADVPPGDWRVRFTYRAPRARLGILLSAVGVVAGLALVGRRRLLRQLPGEPLLPRPGQSLSQGHGGT